VTLNIGLLIFAFLVNIPSAYAGTYSYQVIENNGNQIDLVDLIFVSAQYTGGEFGKYETDVQTHLNYLFSVEPFKSYRRAFNVYRINTTENLGVAYPGDRLATVETEKVLEVVRNIGLVKDPVRELIYSGDSYFYKYYPNYHIIVLVDTEEWRGSGGTVPVASAKFPYITVHEYAHAFGLWDEYQLVDTPWSEDWGEPEAPNVSLDGIKWENIPGAGRYLGATYPNLYRLAPDCIMRSAVDYFCPVCRLHIESILKPRITDTDGDGFSDYREGRVGLNMLSIDTDNDGLPDNTEVTSWGLDDNGNVIMTYFTNPFSPDTDNDMLSDYDELKIHGTNPVIQDTDNDGLVDGSEIKIYQTNPLSADTDNDGLFDGEEISLGTNPLNNDTDGDGLGDGYEITMGLNPLSKDTDGDMWPDDVDWMPTNAFVPNGLIAIVIGGVAATTFIVWKKSKRKPKKRKRPLRRKLK